MRSKCDVCGRSVEHVGHVQHARPEAGAEAFVVCLACDHTANLVNYVLTGRLVTSALVRAQVRVVQGKATHVEQRMSEAARAINAQIARFEEEVWAKGLRALESDTSGGLRLDRQGLSLLVARSAGRVLLTLRDVDGSVSMVTAQAETKLGVMGLQDIDATEALAKALCAEAVSLWQQGVRPKPSRQVRLF